MPPPEEREELGHFGVKRTCFLLRTAFFWNGMYQDVERVVARCAACDRIKARFSAAEVILHSLPIRGLFYRWSLDLMPKLPRTQNGNRHCLVMVEHFTKWVEVAVFPIRSSKFTAQAFLNGVLARYGSCAEVLTDQGNEFRGEFQVLLDRSLIDHRRTSRDHPQADGLAERLVQTFKNALRKFCMNAGSECWDEKLPYVVLGYRVSVQASLASMSPYYLLYGRHPVLPNIVKDSITREVDWSRDVQQCLQDIAERAKLFERIVPMAMNNLVIAQHRDQLRYAHTRSGGYRPKFRKYEPGDYVYLQQRGDNTLDAGCTRTILRVVQVSNLGVAELEGADGRRWKDHIKNLAPCHLPNIDPSCRPKGGCHWRICRARFVGGRTTRRGCYCAIAATGVGIPRARRHRYLRYPQATGFVTLARLTTCCKCRWICSRRCGYPRRVRASRLIGGMQRICKRRTHWKNCGIGLPTSNAMRSGASWSRTSCYRICRRGWKHASASTAWCMAQ